MRKDKVTVITVVFNDSKHIESTIKSVINQTYQDIEYIIIDGKSQDNTIDIIKRYEKKISFWSSEKDNGIYDAMNKGINKSNGDWIIFMNSGDVFASENVLTNVFSTDYSQYDIIYGDYSLTLNGSIINQKCRHNKNGFPIFCHQAVFVRTEYMKGHPFNNKYKLAADFDVLYNAYINGYKFFYIPIVICIYDSNGGLSTSNRALSFIEHSEIMKETKGIKYYYKVAINRIKDYLDSSWLNWFVSRYRIWHFHKLNE